jgi:Transcription termination factor nusG
MDTDWHLLFVRPRFERVVAQHLQLQNLEHCLPTFRAQRARATIELPLFPGYVFCKFADRRRTPVALLPGVLYVRDCELADVDQDVENLRRIMTSGLKYRPWSYAESGALAIAMDGPLSGLAGFVLTGNRFVIPIRSTLRSVIVDVGETCKLFADSSCESSSTV